MPLLSVNRGGSPGFHAAVRPNRSGSPSGSSAPICGDSAGRLNWPAPGVNHRGSPRLHAVVRRGSCPRFARTAVVRPLPSLVRTAVVRRGTTPLLGANRSGSSGRGSAPIRRDSAGPSGPRMGCRDHRVDSPRYHATARPNRGGSSPATSGANRSGSVEPRWFVRSKPGPDPPRLSRAAQPAYGDRCRQDGMSPPDRFRERTAVVRWGIVGWLTIETASAHPVRRGA
jgi:hypothetical protein